MSGKALNHGHRIQQRHDKPPWACTWNAASLCTTINWQAALCDFTAPSVTLHAQHACRLCSPLCSTPISHAHSQPNNKHQPKNKHQSTHPWDEAQRHLDIGHEGCRLPADVHMGTLLVNLNDVALHLRERRATNVGDGIDSLEVCLSTQAIHRVVQAARGRCAARRTPCICPSRHEGAYPMHRPSRHPGKDLDAFAILPSRQT